MARALPWSALTLAMLLVSGRALAQRADEIAIDAYSPPPDQSGFSGFAGTRTPGPWGVDGTLWLGYGYGTYQRPGPDPVLHRFDGTVAVQVGVLSRGALALRMPISLVQRGERVEGEPKVASIAAGNPALDGRIRILGAPVRPDGSVQDGSALALRGVVQVPVGPSDAWYADEKWRAELAAIADIELFGIGAGVSLGYRHRFAGDLADDPARSLARTQAHVLKLSAGLRVPLPIIARALPGKVQEQVMLEVDVATPAKNLFDNGMTPVELRAGYRASVGDLTGTLAVGVGFTEAPGNANVRVLLGLGWSPRQHDQDADGVADSIDQCIHLPEDRDGFQDEDGCADDDNDGDLIVDEDDRCPLEPAEMDRDEDEDGCTDP